MAKSPFKFLDSYTKDDKDIFFGREREVEELYHRVFEGKIMLVYGVSGTGKSSLIHCGLANKFNEADWLPINVRRGGDIVKSMAFAIGQVAITKMEGEVATPTQFKKAVRSLYLDHYKPVFFIFDQFEELFIFGNKEEKKAFVQIVKALIESDLQCRFMFVLREEYLAGITEFERVIPTILVNRVRIERMTLANAKQVIEGPCKVFNIEVEEGFSDEMLEKLSPGSAEVELTYLQVYLDKIFRLATGEGKSSIKFHKDLLQQIGNVSDLLGSFLDEQIELLPDPDSALAVLKSFVSVKGTKRQMSPEEVQDYAQTLGKPLSESSLQELIQTLIQLRILRDKDQNNRYELRHDALATKIYEKITLVEKELLEIRHLIENAYHSWQKRGVLMSAEDLGYIAPYENRLFLSKNFEEFIEKSKYAFVKAKRRRRNLALVSMIILLVVFAGFTLWALNERANAIQQKEIALQKTKEAETANNEKKIIEELLQKNQAASLVVSARKMNILYRGIDNPLDVVIAGIPSDKVAFTITEGKIKKTEDGSYVVTPGSNCDSIIVKVYSFIDGEKIHMGSRIFQVQNLPVPYATINGKNGGEITVDELMSPSTQLNVIINAGGFDMKFWVKDFTVGMYSGGYYMSETTKGNKFSEEQKNLFSRLRPWSFIYVYDIKALGPDGALHDLNSIVFAVREL